jgi:membrane protease YdiL (CAAX protease family)
MDLNKRTIYLLGLLTLIGFGGGGLAVIKYVQKVEPRTIFDTGSAIEVQILFGTLFGVISAIAALALIYRDFIAPVRNFFSALFRGLKLSWVDIVFLSFCAGIGEELLFRGAIQHYLGIWLTAVVFIILHGYLNPFNWRLSVYGLLMVIISAGFGYLYEYVGMIAAMMAHSVIDMILLFKMTRGQQEIAMDESPIPPTAAADDPPID